MRSNLQITNKLTFPIYAQFLGSTRDGVGVGVGSIDESATSSSETSSNVTSNESSNLKSNLASSGASNGASSSSDCPELGPIPPGGTWGVPLRYLMGSGSAVRFRSDSFY